MGKDVVIMLLGAWVALLPFLGFPNKWDTILLVISGIVIIGAGLLFAEAKNVADKNRLHKNLMENMSKPALITGGLVALVGITSFGVFERERTERFVRADVPKMETQVAAAVPPKPKVEHIPTPEAVKAVYMSQCAATSDSFRDSLIALANETEINSIVVDIKDYTGSVVFPSEHTLKGGGGCQTDDFRDLVKRLHDNDIYVIGRVTVFQDPLYTKVFPEYAVKRASATSTVWTDHKGLSFVDVGAKPFWEYIMQIAKEAHEYGVDEINFDYIRYPSDGDMTDVHYDHGTGKKADELEKFFRFLATEMDYEQDEHRPVTSADIFGMTTTNYDDLSIGQVLERALPYFDYIAPMTYPSHYPPGFNGYADPNQNVYGVIAYSFGKAVPRVVATTTPVFAYAHERIGTSTPAIYKKKAYEPTVLRPWLQDFDYGGDYGPEEVRAQIQAAYDAGLTSWMLWAPSNRYTRGGLESATSTSVE